MLKTATYLLLVIAVANADPGIFDEPSFDASLFAGHDSAPILPAPVFSAPAILKAPIFAPAPIFKTIAPAPIIKTIAPAPIIKTIAAAPIIKTVAPASSYASVTQYHVSHPIVKTVLAPQPVLKTLALPIPLAFGHGLH